MLGKQYNYFVGTYLRDGKVEDFSTFFHDKVPTPYADLEIIKAEDSKKALRQYKKNKNKNKKK